MLDIEPAFYPDRLVVRLTGRLTRRGVRRLESLLHVGRTYYHYANAKVLIVDCRSTAKVSATLSDVLAAVPRSGLQVSVIVEGQCSPTLVVMARRDGTSPPETLSVLASATHETATRRSRSIGFHPTRRVSR